MAACCVGLPTLSRMSSSAGGSGTAQELTLRLVGEHQCSNAALAASAAHFLAQNGLPNITQDHIVQGLASATMLARFQVSLWGPK